MRNRNGAIKRLIPRHKNPPAEGKAGAQAGRRPPFTAGGGPIGPKTAAFGWD